MCGACCLVYLLAFLSPTCIIPALHVSCSAQLAPTLHPFHVQANSVSETLSTLNFGKGVTEITLGAAKKNAESGAAWEAKERALKSERDAAGGLR